MASWGKCNFKDFEKLRKQLEKAEKDCDDFCKACAKELAARLLGKVIKRTPVGKYDGTVEFDAHLPGKTVSFTTKSGKHVSFKTSPRVKHVKFTPQKSGLKGGTLRRGWTAQANGSGSEGLKTRGVSQYVDTVRVHHFGDTYVVEINNNVAYASYVEYGHRTANKKGWVPGKFMLTISIQQLQDAAPKILEKKLENWLRGYLDV